MAFVSPDFSTENLLSGGSINPTHPNKGNLFSTLTDSNTYQALGTGLLQLTPALVSLLGVGAAVDDIERRNEQILDTIEGETQAFRFGQNVKEQQLQDLERAVGDKLSANGLERLKTESRLKAGAAETGGAGGSNTEAIQQAGVNQLHANAALLRTASIQKKSTMQQMIADTLGFENKLDAINSGTQSQGGAALAVLSAGLNSGNSALRFFNTTQQEQFFNTQTKGA